MKKTIVFLFTLAMFTAHGQVKWKSVERVYLDLVKAIGDGSKIAPPIESSRTESRVAYYSPSRQTIFIEDKFLTVCATFGADSLNALAFILGHELAHFYRNHGWVTTNGIGYVDAATQETWKDLKNEGESRAKDESEADIFSGFYALIAGYNAMPIAAKTLRTLYDAYGIPDSIPGYPTLKQRVGIADNSMEKSRSLYVLFNVGIYCLSTEKYEVAAKIYTNIYNQDYAGAEILNNLAVAEILQGYQLSAEMPQYYYPILISTETALDPNSRGGEGDAYFRKGIEYLKDALKKDAENLSAYINLASAYAMLNEFVDAEYYLAKADAKDKENASVICLKGIIAAKNGDLKTAKNYWKKEKGNDPFVAKNYAAFIEKSTPKNVVLAQSNTSALALPMIDDVDLTDPSLKSKFQFEIVKIPGLKISFFELESSTLIEIYGGGDIDYRFQCFKSTSFETLNFGWQSVFKSSTATIENSRNYNVLKSTKHYSNNEVDYVKYVWY